MNTKPTRKNFIIVILLVVIIFSIVIIYQLIMFGLVMPKVRENRVAPQNIVTSEKTTKELISDLINQKFNRPENILTVEVIADTGVFAKGTYNETGTGGGIWLAAKTANGWELAFTGNGIVACSDISQYNFPKVIVSSCLDDGIIIDPSWSIIKSSIKNCEVESVFQNHNREVLIKLKNKNEISAIEPEIDDVIDLAISVSSTCGDIIMSTE